MKIKDNYLYDDVPVLKNLLEIKDKDFLAEAESNITYVKLLDIDEKVCGMKFDYNRLKAIHKYIFEDIYEWAGKERIIPIAKGERVLGGDTIRYSVPDSIERDINNVMEKINNVIWENLNIEDTATEFSKLIACLWQIHPFREGNTRTIMTFATQFAETHGFKMNKQLIRENAKYVRDSLVKASDGQYSEYTYLIEIVKDAIKKG